MSQYKPNAHDLAKGGVAPQLNCRTVTVAAVEVTCSRASASHPLRHHDPGDRRMLVDFVGNARKTDKRFVVLQVLGRVRRNLPLA